MARRGGVVNGGEHVIIRLAGAAAALSASEVGSHVLAQQGNKSIFLVLRVVRNFQEAGVGAGAIDSDLR